MVYNTNKSGAEIRRNMIKGDKVMISPEVTMKGDWTPATVIEVEQNPFVGVVISAKTDDGIIYFNRESLFKLAD